MVTGILPFSTKNDFETYQLIKNGEYKRPHGVSKQLKDLLKKLLNIDPGTRITIKDVTEHDWFSLNKSSETDSPHTSIDSPHKSSDSNLEYENSSSSSNKNSKKKSPKLKTSKTRSISDTKIEQSIHKLKSGAHSVRIDKKSPTRCHSQFHSNPKKNSKNKFNIINTINEEEEDDDEDDTHKNEAFSTKRNFDALRTKQVLKDSKFSVLRINYSQLERLKHMKEFDILQITSDPSQSLFTVVVASKALNSRLLLSEFQNKLWKHNSDTRLNFQDKVVTPPINNPNFLNLQIKDKNESLLINKIELKKKNSWSQPEFDNAKSIQNLTDMESKFD